jgi:carbonic anhydrase/acetyltransferase-like protein (isoleucine patch superfamily)
MKRNRLYDLTDDIKIIQHPEYEDMEVFLYRIMALEDIPKHNVKKGDFGGWIEKISNLDGNAWVGNNAMVFEEAHVYDNALVSGNSMVYGNALIYDNSIITGGSIICENASVYGNADIFYSYVYGNVKVFENAKVHTDSHVFGNAKIYGHTKLVWGSCVGGNRLLNLNGTTFDRKDEKNIKKFKKYE